MDVKRNLKVGLSLIIAGLMVFTLPLPNGNAAEDLAAQEIPMASVLYLNDYVFDFRAGEPRMDPAFMAVPPADGGVGTYIVHAEGPILQEWAETVRGAGAEIVAYVPNFAYQVRMTPAAADAVAKLPFVDWVGDYHPAYKISPALEGDMVSVSFYGDVPDSAIQAIYPEISVAEESATGFGHVVRGELRGAGSLESIAANPYVQYISPIYTKELHDEIGMQISGGGMWVGDNDANHNTPYRVSGSFGSKFNQVTGATGAGITIGVADTGLGNGAVGNAGHIDFENRVIGGYSYDGSDWADGHAHGTHCAGLAAANGYAGTGRTYAGFGPYYVGMGIAYDANLYAVKIFSDAGSFIGPTDDGDILVRSYSGGARVSSNSWGAATGGDYIDSDSNYDMRVRDASTAGGNQQLSVLVSAGNSGSGTNTIGSPGNGKNVITVGGVQNYAPDGTSHGNTYGNSNNPDAMYGSSSRGWTDDGRIKPDILTPGQNTLSTHSPNAPANNLFGLLSEDNRYEWCTGTSQSCPTAAGGAAAVNEWYMDTQGPTPTPAMTKAILINTAKDIGTADIPNQNEGWGRMMLNTISDNPNYFFFRDAPAELTTGQFHEYQLSYMDNTKPMKFTLVWTDRYAADGAAVTLINDLRLQVFAPGGQEYRGNAFSGGFTPQATNPSTTFDTNSDGNDDRNNVECVYITNTALQAGVYTVRVSGFNIPGDCDNDGANDQDYALVAYNAAQETKATATGPLGTSNQASVTLTYTTTLTPTSVNLYYTKSTSSPYTWVLAGNDASVDGSYAYTITAGSGTYGWLASAVGGGSTEPSPPGNTIPPEATSYVLDVTSPAAPSGLTVHHYGIGFVPGTHTYNYVGVTQASNNHYAYFNDMDSGAQAELTTPNSRTEFTDAYYTAASISDGSRAGPSADPGVGDEMGVEYRFTIAEDQAMVTQLDITHEAQYSADVTVTLYALGDDAAWDAIGSTQAFSANTEATMTRSITSTLAEYIDASGVLRMVFYPSARGTVAVDYAQVVVTYNSPIGTLDDNTLNWTHSGADVDHYNIYRSATQTGTYSLIASVPVGTNTYEDDGMGQADSTRWWYRVRAVDAATNEESNTNSVQEPGVVVTPPYAISLTGKTANSWVFVSFPSGLTGNIQDLLTDAGTGGDSSTTWSVAKWFNPQTPADPWKTYRAGGSFNDMPTVSNQMGFWLYLTANGGDQMLTLSSYAAIPASTAITLYAGWNLVGYPSMTATTGATLPGAVDIMSVYSGSATYTDYVGAAMDPIAISHGNAYFMHATANAPWTVTNP